MGDIYILSLISALLSLFSQSPFNFGWISLFSFIPLIISLTSISTLSNRKDRFVKGFIQGSLFGLVFIGFSNLWLFELIHFSSIFSISCLYVVFTVMQTFFYSMFAALFCLWRLPLLSFPFMWIIVEWLRGIGPFASTHYAIGYSQVNNGLLLQFASIGGLYFVSFLCLLFNCCFILWYRLHFKKAFSLASLSIPIFLVCIVLSHGLLSQRQPQYDPNNTISLGIYQPNHLQDDKLNKSKRNSLIKDYISETSTTLATQRLDLIIFPETIIPNAVNTPYLMNSLNYLSDRYNTTFLFGSARRIGRDVFNSAVLYKSNTVLSGYNKVYLMPFGEYWPFKSLFTFFSLDNIIPGAEYSKGADIHSIPYNNHFLGVGICLEVMYPSFFQQQTKNGATLLINLANSAWFGTSWISNTLFDIAVLRAVENGRYLVQVSNIGISGIISPLGDIVKSSELNKKEFLSQTLKLYAFDTPFTRYGNWIIFLSWAIILALIFKQFGGFIGTRSRRTWRKFR